MKQFVHTILTDDIHPWQQRLDEDLIKSILREFGESHPRPNPDTALYELCQSVAVQIETVRRRILLERNEQAEFVRKQSRLKSKKEKQQNIIDYAHHLGASPLKLWGDRRAFRRWHDHNAMTDRFNRLHGDLQRKLTFLLNRFGHLAQKFLRETGEEGWHRLNAEDFLSSLVEFEGDPRVTVAAMRALRQTIHGLDEPLRNRLPSVPTLTCIYRDAMDHEKDVWQQWEAVAALRDMSIDSFRKAATWRFENPGESDDIFLRRRLAILVTQTSQVFELLDNAIADPSPYVRQGLGENLHVLPKMDVEKLLPRLAIEDECVATRAGTILAMEKMVDRPELHDILAWVILRSFRVETDAYVTRIAFLTAERIHSRLEPDDADVWQDKILKGLGRLQLKSENKSVRRWAAQTREKIRCVNDADSLYLLQLLAERILEIPVGKTRQIRVPGLDRWDDVELGRLLSVFTQTEFGLDVRRTRKGITVTRGPRFGFRWWRFLYELRHPSPDKRQGFPHTIGRIYEGNLRIPSAILCEMSPTKVPGEPLHISTESGWRPYLPLVDEVISTLSENTPESPLRIVTSEGVTTVVPPSNSVKQARAAAVLSHDFARFANLRNYEENGTEPASEYLSELRTLGFEFQFEGFGDAATDEAVTRFFNPILPAVAAGSLFESARSYFYSVFENTLGELAVFLSITFLFLLGRHWYLNQQFYRLRKSISLVAGGWGTRGKSGTERIKAAMYSALGHRIVSKTTGCEAMFLYGDTFGKLYELFLFRPYGKATIWEQVNIVNLAAKLKSRVFIWECMGLNPEYVKILQRHWMKDDMSTLVNTHPDHEDIQGPAGWNVPVVMNQFMRRNGTLLSSEQTMTPVLTDAARALDCDFEEVGWVEPGLICPDVLERFPYAEHPNNIALVARLGTKVGMEYDFGLREMADRVVADLGVLKVYPTAHLSGRKIQFVNGCSANERFGCMGNWTRCEFDQHDPQKKPGIWISGVVNNRADRISRSRVFAKICVEDIQIDRLYLIGSNLQGMLGYLREAFDEFSKSLTLFPEGEDRNPAELLRELTHRMRLPASEEELRQYLDAIDSGDDNLDSTKWEEAYKTAFAEYSDLLKKLEGSPSKDIVDSGMRELAWKWYERKITPVWDYHATGDQVIHQIVQDTPPGYEHRLMGMQNIKGTGLDFVYRWQAWDTCFNACEKIHHHKPRVIAEGIDDLKVFKDYGILCEEEVHKTMEVLSHSADDSQKATAFKTDMELCVTDMESALATIKATFPRDEDGDKGNKGISWGAAIFDLVVNPLERILDAGDAVRRRKRSDQVYKDMIKGRISMAKAAAVVQEMNKRQGGGWLKKQIKSWRSRISWSQSLQPVERVEKQFHAT